MESPELPKFARILKKRNQKQRQCDDYSEYSEKRSRKKPVVIPEFNDKTYSYISDGTSCTSFISDGTSVQSSIISEDDDGFELFRQKFVELEKQNSQLKKENRRMLDIEQQLEVEKEVNESLSQQLNETQSELQREKQTNSSLSEQIIQLEQILSGKQQITEAKSSMAMRIQEEYKTVTNDYNRMLDIYNTVVVQLRESRIKISELEAELESSRKENEELITKTKQLPLNEPDPWANDFRQPLPPVGRKNDIFDDFTEPFAPKAYEPPQQNTLPRNDFFEEPEISQAKEPLKPPLEVVSQPPPEFGAKKAALVDNIHFGDNAFDEEADIDVSGLNYTQLGDLLDSLIDERNECERLLAKAPKQGISKSRARREKEELSDKIDVLSKKITKVKRALKN